MSEPADSPPAHQAPRTYRVPWALLLRKVFAVDVLHCSRCGGTMQVLAVIADIAIARCILDHLGLDSTGPPVTGARGPPELTKSGTLKPLDPDLP